MRVRRMTDGSQAHRGIDVLQSITVHLYMPTLTYRRTHLPESVGLDSIHRRA
jgi:hypothetical protein